MRCSWTSSSYDSAREMACSCSAPNAWVRRVNPLLSDLCNNAWTLDHLPNSVGRSLVLPLPEDRRQFRGSRSVPEGPGLALENSQIVPPVINGLRWHLVIALEHAAMLAQDIRLSSGWKSTAGRPGCFARSSSWPCPASSAPRDREHGAGGRGQGRLQRNRYDISMARTMPKTGTGSGAVGGQLLAGLGLMTRRLAERRDFAWRFSRALGGQAERRPIRFRQKAKRMPTSRSKVSNLPSKLSPSGPSNLSDSVWNQRPSAKRLTSGFT